MSATLDRAKLTKLLGMLGSAHDGEVAAAGRAANRLVRNSGLTWHDIVDTGQAVLGHARGFQPDIRTLTLEEAIVFAIDRAGCLNSWEVEFCQSLCIQRRRISPKQIEVLRKIVAKAARERAAA
ncbi:MAG: hypothetical protein JO001_08675 [Alphaproteobacteria bacterium]|nr:hypothetical protein [Alphaproteobacteria bacterium]